jgi:hypothetical protein
MNNPKIQFIDDIFHEFSIYQSIILCETQDEKLIYDTLKANDYPIAKMSVEDIQLFGKGKKRMLLVPYSYIDDFYDILPSISSHITHVINFIEDESEFISQSLTNAHCIDYIGVAA